LKVPPDAARRVWLFDLDNTLHDAGAHVFGALNVAMTDYVMGELKVDREEADRLRRHYWLRYGATLLGLVRHHGVRPAHFLHHTHRLPGLEERLRSHPHDRAALRRLPGRKFVLTNAPRAYADRVLASLGLAYIFDGVISIEGMRMFGHWRPKPDRRMFAKVAAGLGVSPARCILVEDTLVHQKAARSLGMTTVWMQRWLRPGARGSKVGVYLHHRPAYVCVRIRSLQQLQSVP